VGPDCLILTPGSDGAIRLTFQAFVNEGDRVVHTSPTFAMYPVYCQMFGAQPQPLHYERGANGSALSIEQIRDHLFRVKPRLFCLPNPDSPTGTVLSPDELRSVIDLCAQLGTVVLIDEAYHPFYEHSCVAWTRDCPHLIVARTFAKAWGLAGLRIGYAVGHPETIAYYHKLRPMYELGTLSIAFMERMLDHEREMQASVRRLLEGKQYFADEMVALGFRVLLTHGNFQHVAFGKRSEAIHRRLEDMVLYRRDFKEDCLSGFSRFSITTRQGFEPIIRAIKEVS
jgi:histidinol-phosphate aminotransferase